MRPKSLFSALVGLVWLLTAGSASAAFIALNKTFDDITTQVNYDVVVVGTAGDPLGGNCDVTFTVPCLAGVSVTVMVSGPWTDLQANENGTPFPPATSNFNADNISLGQVRYGGLDFNEFVFDAGTEFKLGELIVFHSHSPPDPDIDITILAGGGVLLEVLCGFGVACDNPLGQGDGFLLASIPAPEPAVLVLLGAGLAALAFVRRRS